VVSDVKVIFRTSGNMARIRSIKPEFWSSEQVTECSVNARLMFIGMWNFCDDAGRKVSSLKRIKMEIFPGDAFSLKDIRKWMDELISHQLVIEYESEGVVYWAVTGWKHQKISHPQPSTIPEPFMEHSGNGHGTFTPDLNGIDLDISPNDTPDDVELGVPFGEWWKVWPKKVQRRAAEKAYQAACHRADSTIILAATEKFAQSDKARGQFCPYPATWLNQNRWEDDPAEWSDKKKQDKFEYQEIEVIQ